MKTTLQVLGAVVAVAGTMAASGTQAAPTKHHVRHRAVTHHRAQYVIRPSAPDIIVNRHPLPGPRKVVATPTPQTPGAVPAPPPGRPGSTGDTHTLGTSSGVAGTGVPGGPDTQP